MKAVVGMLARDERVTFSNVRAVGNGVEFTLRNENLVVKARELLLPFTQTQVGANLAGRWRHVRNDPPPATAATLPLRAHRARHSGADSATQSRAPLRCCAVGLILTAFGKLACVHRVTTVLPLKSLVLTTPKEIIALATKTAKMSFHDVNTDVSRR